MGRRKRPETATPKPCWRGSPRCPRAKPREKTAFVRSLDCIWSRHARVARLRASPRLGLWLEPNLSAPLFLGGLHLLSRRGDSRASPGVRERPLRLSARRWWVPAVHGLHLQRRLPRQGGGAFRHRAHAGHGELQWSGVRAWLRLQASERERLGVHGLPRARAPVDQRASRLSRAHLREHRVSGPLSVPRRLDLEVRVPLSVSASPPHSLRTGAPLRSGHRMAFDARAGRVLLFERSGDAR